MSIVQDLGSNIGKKSFLITGIVASAMMLVPLLHSYEAVAQEATEAQMSVPADTADTSARDIPVSPLPSPTLVKSPPRHAEIEKLEREGGKAEYLGHSYGLDGWILMNKQGEPKYAYTNDKGALVLGMLIGPDGKIKTLDQLRAYKARLDGSQAALPGAGDNDVSKVEKFYAEVEKASWVSMGKADAPYLYMFANVNCEHCQKFWQDLEPLVNAGSLQVRFVPFGAKELNRNGGAALLSSNDPLATWKKYVGGDKNLLSKDYAFEDAYKKIDANTSLAQKWQLQGPPFTIYRRPFDGTLTAVVGRPENTMLVTADLMRKE